MQYFTAIKLVQVAIQTPNLTRQVPIAIANHQSIIHSHVVLLSSPTPVLFEPAYCPDSESMNIVHLDTHSHWTSRFLE
jgi:hypothetical protein